jgi:hypothetical protein
LLESAGFEPQKFEGLKARYYACNTALVDEKGALLLNVKWGGANPHPHVECKGRASPFVAAHLRQWFDHRPTRIDHAVDMRGEGQFDTIADLTRAMAKRFGLRWAPAGDWATADAGRTIYLGSRKSQIMVRIYEKGLEYCARLGLPVTDELRHWVRYEIEFKPQNKRSKAIAAKIEGRQIWGSSEWTRHLAEGVLNMAVEPISIRERRESNRERALRFMASQYGAHLGALLDDCNHDLAEFGRAIADMAGLLADVEDAA